MAVTTQVSVTLRYDETQPDEVRVTAEDGTLVLSFGPTLPTGEGILAHVLRAEVTPACADQD